MMNFYEKLEAIRQKNNSLLCIGLDSDLDKIGEQSQFEFNKQIIEATHDLVCAYKPNTAFYEADGARGIQALKNTCDYLHDNYPQIPMILDAKRADIGNTNKGYAKFAFDYLRADAITLHPYMGGESLEEFIEHSDKYCFVMGRNSNPGAGELQDLEVNGNKLYEKVVSAANSWGPNVSVVAGATYPEELANVRKLVDEQKPLLVPGIGAQGGDVKSVLQNGGRNLIICTSRAVIFSDNPNQAASDLNNEINQEL